MKEACFENIKSKESSLPERTAEQISKLIVEQHLTCEDKLPSEFELAELLHVGRGTVREGVKLLVARNVLEIRRGKGTYIARNPGEIPDPLGFAYYPDQLRLALDLAEIRGQMEPWVARMAAEHATTEDIVRLRESCSVVEQDILNERDHSQNDVAFHVAIAKCTQNLVVPKLIPIITYAVKLFVSLTESRLRTETVIGHREIVEAISNGDGQRAEKVMAQHIEYNRALLQEIVEKMKRDGAQNESAGS
ncbi:MAG TPA: FadR family transcriptional regulator [Candidatus Butyricicoccus stercorigallinarum]|nr:FadR family transcriptional regulator [Candidatus Butyricicoccus stercorigallinarum]